MGISGRGEFTNTLAAGHIPHFYGRTDIVLGIYYGHLGSGPPWGLPVLFEEEMMQTRRILGVTIGATLIATGAVAQPLFSDDFDSDHTANWTINNGPTDSNVDVFFDYSTLGIPSAPRSVGGTTRGMRFLVNQSNGIFGGVSASPIGQSFSGDYKVTADVWLNFIGPAPAGGSGTTQVAGMGVMTAGTTPQWPGGTQDSVYFMTTLDGGSSADWRAYSPAAPTSYIDGDPVYFATTRNSSNAYYSVFGGGTPPAAQTALWASQTGAAQAGCIAFAWHEMLITKTGNQILFTVKNPANGVSLNIARVDVTGMAGLGGSNIVLAMSDTNSGSSTDPNDFLNAAIFDNVRVVPEPATFAVLGIGAAALMRRRRQK